MNQGVGKSEYLGPKTSIISDLRNNKVQKWFHMISRVMRESHVEFQQKKIIFAMLNSSSFPTSQEKHPIPMTLNMQNLLKLRKRDFLKVIDEKLYIHH